MPAPKVAVLFLTPACNMSCAFCGADAGFDPMEFGQALGLLKDLKARGLESVVLGGGEPLMWKHSPAELSAEARRLGLVVQIGSNGILAPADEAGLRAYDRWILPLESVTPGLHDRMRPTLEGSHFAGVTDLMQRLKKAGIEVTLSSLVSHENFDSLLEVGEHLSRYQAHGGRLHAWHLYRFLALGRAGVWNARRFSTAEGVFEGLGRLLKARHPAMQIYLRPDMYHSRQVAFYWSQDGNLKIHENKEVSNSTN